MKQLSSSQLIHVDINSKFKVSSDNSPVLALDNISY